MNPRIPQPLSLEELAAKPPAHLRLPLRGRTARRVGVPSCAICERKHYAKGLCNYHYDQDRGRGIRNGSIVPTSHGAASRASGWRGGVTFTGDGRALCYREWHPNPTQTRKNKHGCYVLRYRLVMEAKLGRFLEKGEIVHHVNGDSSDDSPDNLQLSTQSEHAKIHGLGANGNQWIKTKKWEHGGEFRSLREWSQVSGLPQQVLRDRIRRGKSLTEVITENRPIRGHVKVTYHKQSQLST